ncbi:MAG: hypothetical protein AB4426_23590 [Xenococcaceae cyanobacterium]
MLNLAHEDRVYCLPERIEEKLQSKHGAPNITVMSQVLSAIADLVVQKSTV